jgi:hypothetical protein
LYESLNNLKKPLTLFLIGAFFLCFHAGLIIARLSLSVNGKIISSEKGNNSENPARYFTIYQIQEPITGKLNSYKAEGNDYSLPRDLMIGSIIEKRSRKLDYFVNQKRVDDFPWKIYFAFVFAEICLMAFAGYRQLQYIQDKKAVNQAARPD